MRRLLSSLATTFALICALPAIDTAASAEAADSPRTSTAAAQAAVLTSETLTADLTRQLTTALRIEGDLQLQLVNPWKAPALSPAGDWQLVLIETPSLPASEMIVHCRIVSGGAVAADFMLPVHAQLLREAWITREPVEHAQNFDAAVLDTRRVDMLREHDLLPATTIEHDSVFARAMPAGRLVTWHDVARKDLVRKGDMVEVNVTDGALLITLKAQAMESGARGDQITIRNLESQKNFTALVVDASRVQVRL